LVKCSATILLGAWELATAEQKQAARDKISVLIGSRLKF
jgi:hypothetical protein